jgi:hypothetical protein
MRNPNLEFSTLAAHRRDTSIAGGGWVGTVTEVVNISSKTSLSGHATMSMH